MSAALEYNMSVLTTSSLTLTPGRTQCSFWDFPGLPEVRGVRDIFFPRNSAGLVRDTAQADVVIPKPYHMRDKDITARERRLLVVSRSLSHIIVEFELVCSWLPLEEHRAAATLLHCPPSPPQLGPHGAPVLCLALFFFFIKCKSK